MALEIIYCQVNAEYLAVYGLLGTLSALPWKVYVNLCKMQSQQHIFHSSNKAIFEADVTLAKQQSHFYIKQSFLSWQFHKWNVICEENNP